MYRVQIRAAQVPGLPVPLNRAVGLPLCLNLVDATLEVLQEFI